MLCEACGGMNPVERCFFEATATETVTHKVKDPTVYVALKHSNNCIRKWSTTKKGSC